MPTKVANKKSVDAGSAPDVRTVGCGCGTQSVGVTDGEDGRKAVAVDSDAKEGNQKRLRRIEGQVRGLQRMVEEDRYCADILTQLSSVQEALRGVARELLRNHLRHCASAAIKGGPEQAGAMYDEIVTLFQKHQR
jgi:DNA-binding FrmR family transcriptional regulator